MLLLALGEVDRGVQDLCVLEVILRWKLSDGLMESAALALDVNLLDRLFACTPIVVHLFLNVNILV